MSDESNKKSIIDEVSFLITKGNAHVSFEQAVKGIPVDMLAVIPEHLPYNIWQLTEHIRITQWDILEFCLNPNHKSPKWPDGYWVSATTKPDEQQWMNSLKQVKEDREKFLELLKNPATDLYKPLEHGTGQNILREALLIADHTAYHTGEIIVLRRLLHLWES
jgi:hypothetical protein